MIQFIYYYFMVLYLYYLQWRNKDQENEIKKINPELLKDL